MARAFRGAIGACLLVALGTQSALATQRTCGASQQQAGSTAMAGMDHARGMAMPAEAGVTPQGSKHDQTPRHCPDCGTYAMVGGCTLCSVPAVTVAMLAQASRPTVGPAAPAVRVSLRSIDASPDVPPPKA